MAEYEGEEVYVKESSYEISPVIIERTLQERGLAARVYWDRGSLPLDGVFNGRNPRVAFLGFYSHNHSYAGNHSQSTASNPIEALIKDLELMKTFKIPVFTMATSQAYKKFRKKGALRNIPRNHTNIDLEIAILAAQALFRA